MHWTSPLGLGASKDEWLSFLPWWAHSLAGLVQGQTQRENRPEGAGVCSSSFLRRGIRSQGAAWNGEVVLIPEVLGSAKL